MSNSTTDVKKMSPQLAYYYRKKEQDPEFYEREKIRLNESSKKRYQNNEQARERIKEQARQRYYRLKLERQS